MSGGVNPIEPQAAPDWVGGSVHASNPPKIIITRMGEFVNGFFVDYGVFGSGI